MTEQGYIDDVFGMYKEKGEKLHGSSPWHIR